jgi:ribosomal protein S27AE
MNTNDPDSKSFARKSVQWSDHDRYASQRVRYYELFGGRVVIKCPKCGFNIGPVLASHAGKSSTPAKAKAARENAKKGGWPKGRPRKEPSAIKTKRKRRSR